MHTSSSCHDTAYTPMPVLRYSLCYSIIFGFFSLLNTYQALLSLSYVHLYYDLLYERSLFTLSIPERPLFTLSIPERPLFTLFIPERQQLILSIPYGPQLTLSLPERPLMTLSIPKRSLLILFIPEGLF